jgi:hypothetical protein
MTYKWNLQEAENYSKSFSALICTEFFKLKNNITGSEILGLTEIKQLNLFSVKNLYTKWQEENAKLQSPYFDYSKPEVNQALNEFMNILSRHISVNRENFQPLLENSVLNTLQLYVDPLGFFENLMRSLPDFKLTASWLKENGRYFKSYSWVLSELLERLNGLPFVYANQATDWVKEILKPEKFDDNSNEIKDFDNFLQLPFQNGNTDLEPETSKTSSFFDFGIDDAAPKVYVEKPMQNTIEQKISSNQSQSIIAEAIEAPINSVQNNPIETFEKKTINDQASLVSDSLQDYHQRTKIESIRAAISLNQRFLFINNLFGGNVQAFSSAIDELEACRTFSDAKEQMIKNFMPKYQWDIKSPEAEEFFDILKRRFN